MMLLVLYQVVSSGCQGITAVSEVNRPPKTREEWRPAPKGQSPTRYENVAFTSTPPGAEVYLDGSGIGATPVSADVPLTVSRQDQWTVSYRPAISKGSSLASDFELMTLVPAMFSTTVVDLYGRDRVQFQGGGRLYFPEKVIAANRTGQSRESVNQETRQVQFRFKGLVGDAALHLPDDKNVDLNFGTVRKQRSVRCSLHFARKGAAIGVLEPRNASVEQSTDGLLVSPGGLEQDGLGRWWLDGRWLDDPSISIKLARLGGQWIPPSEALVIPLPAVYGEDSVALEKEVPLSGIPWDWTKSKDWPPIDDTPMSAEANTSWARRLAKEWLTRKDDAPNPYHWLMDGLILRALSEQTDSAHVEDEVRSFIRGLIGHKINMAFMDFGKADPAIDPARSFEIQEDTIRGIQDSSKRFLLLREAEKGATRESSNQSARYVMQVDLAGIEVDTKEHIARNAGRVQIGTHREPNPQYCELSRERDAAQEVLANAASEGLAAESSAERHEGAAVIRCLLGGALAHNSRLSPGNAEGLLRGTVHSVMAANAERQKEAAHQAEMAQARSLVDQANTQLSSLAEFTEEPIYQEFRTEDRYVVKTATATAYVKVVDTQASDSVAFSRKIIVDTTVSGTSQEANPATGTPGHGLDIASDTELRRDVSAKLTQALARQVLEGFVFRLGLEAYGEAKAAGERHDADGFAESGMRFLLSPAASAYPEQASEIRVFLEGLLQRASRNEQEVRIAELLGLDSR
jgi:hypothetical protein